MAQTTIADPNLLEPQNASLLKAWEAASKGPVQVNKSGVLHAVETAGMSFNSLNTTLYSDINNFSEDKYESIHGQFTTNTTVLSTAETIVSDTGLKDTILKGIDQFFDGMPVFMAALDAVGDLHPFIKGKTHRKSSARV
jgi:hypothetical protein